MPPKKLLATLHTDLSSEPVQKILRRPSAAAVFADLIWALGATGKFVWPIPLKGLEKAHASYQSKKTLIVWGEEMTH